MTPPAAATADDVSTQHTYLQQINSMSTTRELDGLSIAILSFVAQLDKLGAYEVNLNVIASVTAVLILVIKKSLGKLHGVDWYGFVHALITGVGSVMCLYLDTFAAEVMVDELYNPGQCADKPLTSLHRILPAITMGYAVFDLLDSFDLRLDFLLHGAATFSVMGLFVWNDVPHLVNSMLLMEVSSIFLNLVRYKHFTPFWSFMNQLCFAVSFFLVRIVLVPYIWGSQVSLLLKQEQTEDYCPPWYFSKCILVLGPFFHILNAYWFYKIIKKIIRKATGQEKLNERNDLIESEHEETIVLAKKNA